MLINTQTTFRDCRVRVSLFWDNLSQNSCIQVTEQELTAKLNSRENYMSLHVTSL